MNFAAARLVANAVLYEGYILYPYRPSAQKNRLRWQFGVVAPRASNDSVGSDPWATQTECLVEIENDAVIHIKARFLQMQARTVEQAEYDGFRSVESLAVDHSVLVPWQESIEREIEATIKVSKLFDAGEVVPIEISGGEEKQLLYTSEGELAGRVVRQSWPISGRLIVAAEKMDGPVFSVKLRIRIENSAPCDERFASREEALRHSLIGSHVLLGVEHGSFISLLDPPDWATQAVASCVNLHTWPVLVDKKPQRHLMLSAPIILYDYPEVAPESPGDFFDATEIDELLTLRTLTLTDAEKREARGTDERAAAILNRVETMPAAIFSRLHGAVRESRGMTGAEEKTICVGGVRISKGSKVRLHPGTRRADAQDIFLGGRVAKVERILVDVEDKSYLGVTLTDDPGADLHEWYGRFLYFSPDEVEPVSDAGQVLIQQEKK